MPEDEMELPQCPNPTQNNLIPDEENQKFLNSIINGDLYVLGKLWIDVLKIGLLGTKWRTSVIPVIKAESPIEEHLEQPRHPPKMRYKDLPIYSSPHVRYKESLERQQRECPEVKEKLLQKFLLPHIRSYRQWIQENYSDFTCEVNTMKEEAMTSFRDRSDRFVKYMRNPENIQQSQATVTFGGISGFCLGNTIPQKVAFSGAGLLATGALGFPKETDEIFRYIAFHLWKLSIQLFNIDSGYTEKVKKACHISTELPPRTPSVCPSRTAEPCTTKPCITDDMNDDIGE